RPDQICEIVPSVPLRPIPPSSVNQSAPSGPVVIQVTSRTVLPTGNSVMWPRLVTRPIVSFPGLAYQSAPSEPTVSPSGPCGYPQSVHAGTSNSVMSPLVVIRPIPRPDDSLNQSAPSGPLTIVRATAGFGSGKNENPLESRLPIPGGEITVYQTAPSAPFAIPCGRCAGAGSLNSRTFPTVATAIPEAASAASKTARAAG